MRDQDPPPPFQTLLTEIYVYMSIELYLAEGSEGNKDLYCYRGSSKAKRKQQINKGNLKLCP